MTLSPSPAPLPARRAVDEQSRLDEALRKLHEELITFNQVLGLKVVSVKHGDVRSQLTMKPEFVGHYRYGRLHGGVISATLDTMGGFALMVGLGEKYAHESAAEVMKRFDRMGTIDLRVDYLRAGIGPHFVATAEVTRLGGRIGTTLMRMVDAQGQLIATGAGAYVVS